MTKMPFQTPVDITDRHYLVATDRELICTIGDATPEEKCCIVTAINAHEDLVMALQGCLTIIDIYGACQVVTGI